MLPYPDVTKPTVTDIETVLKLTGGLNQNRKRS